MTVLTKKFSEFADGGDLKNDDITVGLEGGVNTQFNNPWTFLAEGTSGDRPTPAPEMYYRLRFNTTLESYEYYSPVLNDWIQIDDSIDVQTFPFVIYTSQPLLPNAFNLGSLAGGLLKQTVLAGVATPSIAVSAVDYWAPGNALTRTQAPLVGDDVTNKTYVDAVASGFHFVNAVNAASTANFVSTYNNGASGVGATLTANSNGAFTLDGEAGVLNNRYLMKNQSVTYENGVYVLTQVGDGSTPAILTRAADFDTPEEIQPGDLVPVLAGTVNESTMWVQSSTVTTVGTSPITFILFSINPADIVTIPGTQTITGAKTFSNDVVIDNSSTLQLNSTVAIDEILDEDDMASDSNTAVPTQQSVKAYVDNNISAAASQADMETATSTSVFSSPGRQQFHPGHPKAWINFNGTGTIAINASYNVSGIVDNGTGNYTVNYTTNFSSVNYCASSGSNVDNTNAAGWVNLYSFATSSIRVSTVNPSGNPTDYQGIFIIATGDQ